MKETDFSRGPVWRSVVSQAAPLTAAQLVHLLYNVVDRIYIGHLEDVGGMALTGVGLTFPIVTLIMAFSALFGAGAVPLFAMSRGRRDDEGAGRIMGTSASLLLVSSVVLTAAGYIFMRPVLFAFGASEDSFVFSSAYLRYYLIGTVFSMAATGLVGFINAEGFARVGMRSIVVGAVCNIALDPLFIFTFGMGVAGAAAATVISQAVSAVWVVAFLAGRRAPVRLQVKNLKIIPSVAKNIAKLGASNFIMQGTTCLVQIVCNATLQRYGGDLYVGIMTVTNSVRDVFMLPVSGITSGAGPVVSYNFGAGEYERAKAGIRFTAAVGTIYTAAAWLAVLIFPSFWFGIFSSDPEMTEVGVGLMRTYFFGFVFMAFQFSGQSAFQAVGDARHAITFSLLRKVVIVVPLTLLLPVLGFGTTGVFLAEPISNAVGGAACFITMYFTVYRRLGKSLAAPRSV